MGYLSRLESLRFSRPRQSQDVLGDRDVEISRVDAREFSLDNDILIRSPDVDSGKRGGIRRLSQEKTVHILLQPLHLTPGAPDSSVSTKFRPEHLDATSFRVICLSAAGPVSAVPAALSAIKIDPVCALSRPGGTGDGRGRRLEGRRGDGATFGARREPPETGMIDG